MGFWGAVNKVRDTISGAASNVQSAVSDAKDMASYLYNDKLDDTRIGAYIKNNIDAAGQGIGTILGKATDTGPALQAIDNIQSPVDMANYATDNVDSLVQNISGKTAKEQYEQTRTDAWKQYQEQFDYLKQENELARQRADTALQRQMADALKAGLSPLSSSIQGAENGSEGGTVGGNLATPTSSAGMGGLGAVLGLINPILGAVVSRQNAETAAETAQLNAQTQADTQTTIAEMQNQTMQAIAGAKQKGEDEERPGRIKLTEAQTKKVEADTKKVEADTKTAEYEQKYNETYGISTNTPEKVKTGSTIGSMIEQALKGAKKLQENEQVQSWLQKQRVEGAQQVWKKAKMPEEEFAARWERWNTMQDLKDTYGTWDMYVQMLKKQRENNKR